MTFYIILILATILIPTICKLLEYWDVWYNGDAAAGFSGILLGFILLLFIIITPLEYAEMKGKIQVYKCNTIFIQQTESNLKSATILNKIVEYNTWLLEKQNANKYFDLAIPDEINDLKPITIKEN